jgi:hypothetical protein
MIDRRLVIHQGVEGFHHDFDGAPDQHSEVDVRPSRRKRQTTNVVAVGFLVELFDSFQAFPETRNSFLANFDVLVEVLYRWPMALHSLDANTMWRFVDKAS